MNIIEDIKKIPGKSGLYYKNLSTGEVLAYNETEEFHPASMIKLPVFMAISKMVAEGKADWNEKIRITYDVRVPSCGAFNAFTDEPVVDVKTLCNLMITISDNTAANVLISHFGIDRLNGEFAATGLEKTHLERLFYDDEMQAKGFNNKAVPAELGGLLEKLHRKTFVNEKVSDEVLAVLYDQQDKCYIPEWFEDECPVANKTGGARGILGDEALVQTDKPFVLVMMFNETVTPEAAEFMRHAGKQLYLSNTSR